MKAIEKKKNLCTIDDAQYMEKHSLKRYRDTRISGLKIFAQHCPATAFTQWIYEENENIFKRPSLLRQAGRDSSGTSSQASWNSKWCMSHQNKFEHMRHNDIFKLNSVTSMKLKSNHARISTVRTATWLLSYVH